MTTPPDDWRRARLDEVLNDLYDAVGKAAGVDIELSARLYDALADARSMVRLARENTP